MPSIAVTTQAGEPADTRVVGIFEGVEPDDRAVAALVSSGEAKGALKKVAVTHDGDQRVIAVGLGSQEAFDVERARVAAAVAAQRARDLGSRSLSWALPAGEGVAGGIVEGTLM